MSPGTPTTIVSAVTRSSASRSACRSVAIDPRSIDFAQEQERLDRKALGEAAAVMLEIAGHRRLVEAGHQPAEADVELAAAAVGEHADLPRPPHAGGDVAVAQAVAHQLALHVPRRRAPAVGPQARRRS